MTRLPDARSPRAVGALAGAVSWANAGHPPPLLRPGAGQSRYLEGGDGLIGIEDTDYGDFRASVDEGATLMLYTDGLIERRGESPDAGIERLARAAASGPASPEAFCKHILERVLPPAQQLHDDVTVVVVRVT